MTTKTEKANVAAKLWTTQASYEKMIANMVQGMDSVFTDPKQKTQAIVGIMKMLPYDKLIQYSSNDLDRYFTEPELDEFVTFLKTPLGMKWVNMYPEMAQQQGLRIQEMMIQSQNEFASLF